MSRRTHIPLKTKLASALLTMVRPDESGNMVPVIPREEAKRMSPEAVLSRFHFDHVERKALGGTDDFWNLQPLPVDEHRTKTAKIDVPAIAKVKRLSREEEEFRARLLAKADGTEPRPSARQKKRIPSRPFQRKKKETAR